MYAAQDRREREREAAVDLSFSQILEVRSSSYKRRPHASNGSSLPRFQRQLHRHSAPSAFKTPPSSHGRSMLDSVYEDSEETSVYSPMQRRETRGLSSGSLGGSSSSFTEDEEWLTGDEQVGKDMYRFVQPRRLSSWVQDDAVNACFKCHTLFTMIIRKHHCRYVCIL
jgi:phosphatidylinositol 3-kinase